MTLLILFLSNVINFLISLSSLKSKSRQVIINGISLFNFVKSAKIEDFEFVFKPLLILIISN